MRAARAGPVLRGQCFANEQILRGPALAARKGPVQACLQGNLRVTSRTLRPFFFTVYAHCRTKIQGAGLDPHLGGGDGRFRGGDGWV